MRSAFLLATILLAVMAVTMALDYSPSVENMCLGCIRTCLQRPSHLRQQCSTMRCPAVCTRLQLSTLSLDDGEPESESDAWPIAVARGAQIAWRAYRTYSAARAVKDTIKNRSLAYDIDEIESDFRPVSPFPHKSEINRLKKQQKQQRPASKRRFSRALLRKRRVLDEPESDAWPIAVARGAQIAWRAYRTYRAARAVKDTIKNRSLAYDIDEDDEEILSEAEFLPAVIRGAQIVYRGYRIYRAARAVKDTIKNRSLAYDLDETESDLRFAPSKCSLCQRSCTLLKHNAKNSCESICRNKVCKKRSADVMEVESEIWPELIRGAQLAWEDLTGKKASRKTKDKIKKKLGKKLKKLGKEEAKPMVFDFDE